MFMFVNVVVDSLNEAMTDVSSVDDSIAAHVTILNTHKATRKTSFTENP